MDHFNIWRFWRTPNIADEVQGLMLTEGGWVSWGHPSFLSHNSSLNIIIKKLSNDKKRNHSLKYLSETDGSGDSEKILPLLQSSWKSTAVCHLEKDDTPQWWACLGKMEEKRGLRGFLYKGLPVPLLFPCPVGVCVRGWGDASGTDLLPAVCQDGVILFTSSQGKEKKKKAQGFA